MPSRAGRPGIGRSEERFGAAAGAAAGVAGAAAVVGAAGWLAWVGGVVVGVRGGTLRCMPVEPPLPRRRASASLGARPAPRTARDRATIIAFIGCSSNTALTDRQTDPWRLCRPAAIFQRA